MSYEYKVVPAPMRGAKAKGLKTAEDRFAFALQTAMNDLARDGWEYLRADTLPCEQREGLMSKTTIFQNMLVFRRAKGAGDIATPARSEPRISAPVSTPGTGEEPAVDHGQTAPAPAPADEDGDAKSDKKPSSDVAAE